MSPFLIGGRGYELIVDPDEPRATSPRIAHHRLILYAEGEIESPFEPLEVDHLTPVPWLNYAENLDAVTPEEHGRRTRRRARRRREGTA